MTTIKRMRKAIAVVVLGVFSTAGAAQAEAPKRSTEQIAAEIGQLKLEQAYREIDAKHSTIWAAVGLGAGATFGTLAFVATGGTGLPVIYAVGAFVHTTLGGYSLGQRSESLRQVQNLQLRIERLERELEMLKLLSEIEARRGSNIGRTAPTAPISSAPSGSPSGAGIGR